MDPATLLLAHHLELGTTSPQAVRFIISCFNDYVFKFLWNNRLDLDPDLRQVMARMNLTMAHRYTEWLWMQNTPEAQILMAQEEHATNFVLRVLTFLVDKKLCPKECPIDQAVFYIHRWLCVLQSLWLGNGVWVEIPEDQMKLRTALTTAMDNELVQNFQGLSIGL